MIREVYWKPAKNVRPSFASSRKCRTIRISRLPRNPETHQIRVHFAYFNYPIVGDHLYNKQSRANDPISLILQQSVFQTSHLQSKRRFRARSPRHSSALG
ncbi:MAG: hypothetical protein MZU97_03995 [Bacillus subtilis]|nr:hypothetical protein [Bacillus subtilis]